MNEKHPNSGLLHDFDSMLEGIQVVDRDWRYLYVNSAVAAQGKSTREALIGKTMMEKYPGIEKTGMFSLLRECMDKRAVRYMQNEFDFPDGTKGWFELRMEPVPQGVLILSIDITERKRAEDALKKLNIELESRVRQRTAELNNEKNKFETLIQSIGDGVVAIDRYWSITLWNRAAVRITGWTKAEAVGTSFRDKCTFIRANDRMENVAFIEEAMVMNKTVRMKNSTLLITKDGREIPVGDSAAPVTDANGNVIGAIIIFRDVSEEYSHLELRTGFMYASHQLRTPATEVNWALELALDAADIITIKEHVAAAQNSLVSVIKLADELVDASEIDQETVLPDIQEFSASKLFEDLDKKLGSKAAKYNVKLEFATIKQISNIRTDQRMFSRLLEEVIDNAIVYAAKQSTVGVRGGKKGDRIVFEIHNMGAPIPEAEQVSIFSKFYRGSNRDQEIPGAGLGLYIARAYVALLGGKIWFKSTKDAGTTFFIALPS